MEKNNCKYCGKVLQKVGELRKNGKMGKRDWEGRATHSKCYKHIMTMMKYFDCCLGLVDTEKEKDKINALIAKHKGYLVNK